MSDTNTANRTTPKASRAGLAYALLCYAITNLGLGTFVLFLNDVVLPFGVNDPAELAGPTALAINLGLVLMWGAQHSVMARRRFKAWWTTVIPAHTERATYCLASALALGLVCVLWQPLPGAAWSLEVPILRWGITGLGLSGWLLLLAASFEIDHFELFGIRQTLDALTGRTRTTRFQARHIYARVRHPIQTGILMGMWITPDMSASRLTLAAMMTLYILVGLYFEERDLMREFGQRYRAYMRRVPGLFPSLLPRRAAPRTAEAQPRDLVSLERVSFARTNVRE